MRDREREKEREREVSTIIKNNSTDLQLLNYVECRMNENLF